MSNEYLELYDYRLRVKAMYERRDRALEGGDDPREVIEAFRWERDELFRSHPQSPLDAEQRLAFAPIEYFPYNANAVVRASLGAVTEGDARHFSNEEETFRLIPAARLAFSISGIPGELTVFWIQVYGGGLFLPFVDATAPAETYGGGRYLVDTIKGSTFAGGLKPGSEVLVDFNYAYNPSCAYNVRWVCPLAPPENRLPFAVRAGEKKFEL